MLQSAKIVIALGAGCLTILIWGVNPHDEGICLAVLASAKDTILFCLGARATVMVSDTVESIMTQNKSEETKNVNISVKRDPKDFDVPLEELAS